MEIITNNDDDDDDNSYNHKTCFNNSDIPIPTFFNEWMMRDK